MALKTGEDFTKDVLKRYEDIPDPRLREVMQAAVKHLHAFVSEVQPTGEEWFKAIQYLTAIGHKCDDKRQEFILLSDMLGVSACWWTTSTTGASPARPPRRSKAHSTSRMRLKSPMAATWRRARPAFRASSPERCAA